MLPAAARLRRRAEFTATVRGGRRAGRGAVVVHIVPGTPVPVNDGSTSPGAFERPGWSASGAPRAGFVVSRAVGGAVVRNAVRRRLRHLVRARLDGLPPGSTLVVRALPSAATRSYADLGAALDAALAAATRTGRRPAGASGRSG